MPAFGSCRLGDIKLDSVKRFLTQLRARGLVKNTIRLAATTLRVVVNAAIEDKLIEHNPAQGLGRFVKSEKPEREASSLNPTEIDSLLRADKGGLPLPYYALLLTALRAGLREGELAALQWEDIQAGRHEDDVDRYMLVQRNYDRRKMLTAKNRKSRRVDMSRELRHTLLALRNERLLRTDAKSNLAEGCASV